MPAPPLTLQHLQHHVHDVLVTGISALKRRRPFRKKPLAARAAAPVPRDPSLLPVSPQKYFQHLTEIPPAAPTPILSGLGLGTSPRGASFPWEPPASGQKQRSREISKLEGCLAWGPTHRHSLSPGPSGHAAVSRQSSRAGEPGVALHPGDARIPAGAPVARFSADSLLPGGAGAESG